ncbi:prolipoprotein diacylglyceryl transferase [Macrococcus equipercicus]|uniref:Phosphatidylglycerol--prolipoprotein diacylglyceryl transferase n=1 Tax=Macrococcus equipercicus TaxID=69967 RepID=A0A9Q9BTY0_9STAP|nr:prolipoprotein diacylglyceryl transferase [Macrococcus equipercicus]KAA1042464.1 prolipoprotein diacylglyceryl transferase [Macrococcus equipercicus]UTH14349.1 prolipoprotein diacylglyceryl transferase [Macrococcus equipercicus]
MLSAINPIAFELGPLSVRWYGIIIASAILIGYLIAQRESVKKGYKEDTLIDIIVWAVIIAIICARIYYVAFEWSYYKAHPAEIPMIMNGGIAIHGGLIGAFSTGFILAKRKNLSFFQLADIVAPSIILAQAIGRWGNFMNQEAHGGEVSRTFLEQLMLPEWIINQMNVGGTYYHPTFLYESLWSLTGFVMLLLVRKHLRIGQTFLLYAIWYSIGRFFVEGLRTDSLMLTEHLRIAQVISIVIITVAVITWLYRAYRYRLPKYGDVNVALKGSNDETYK